MQFTTITTFFSALVLAATAFAAPAAVADSGLEARAGAATWEFHPFTDTSCQQPFSDVPGGPQTAGSQCIDVTSRFGGNVHAATSPQGCKAYVFLNGNTDCSGPPGEGAQLSGTCQAYPTPISSVRVDC